VSFSSNLEQIRFIENPPESTEPSPEETTKRIPKRRKVETKEQPHFSIQFFQSIQ
jgi:hypothetical protein